VGVSARAQEGGMTRATSKAFPNGPLRGPRPWYTPDALPSPILSGMSRLCIAAPRLAASRCVSRGCGLGEPPAGRKGRLYFLDWGYLPKAPKRGGERDSCKIPDSRYKRAETHRTRAHIVRGFSQRLWHSFSRCSSSFHPLRRSRRSPCQKYTFGTHT
jgi:hypothetical protein